MSLKVKSEVLSVRCKDIPSISVATNFKQDVQQVLPLATQKSEINLDVNSELNNGSTELKQSTKGSGMIEQSTSTKNAAFLLQSQRNTTTVYHFQASIEGGPSIQNQMSQIHNFQFSTVVER